MRQQRILMEWPADKLVKALEVVIDEQDMSALKRRLMTKKLRKLVKHGQLEVSNMDTEWLYRLCCASLQQHEYHWFAWEWRNEWVSQLVTQEWCYPPWFGVDAVHKRVLVVAEQGLGDEILFSSCYHEFAEDVEEAWIECDPRLMPIFRRSFPENLHFVSRFKSDKKRVVPLMTDYPAFHEGRPIEAFVPAGNVPKLYRHSARDFPRARRRWLRAHVDSVNEWRDWLRERGLFLGCSWKGRQGEIEPLDAGVSLQYGANYHGNLRAPPIDLKWDVDGVFALIYALNKVVTTTNAVAHMAGSLGVPTDCIKPPPIYATAEDEFNNRVQPWWPLDYNDWYPSITMFRNQHEWRAKQ